MYVQAQQQLRVQIVVDDSVDDDETESLPVLMEHSLVLATSMVVFVSEERDELFVAGVHPEHLLVAISCDDDGIRQDLNHEEGLLELFNRYNDFVALVRRNNTHAFAHGHALDQNVSLQQLIDRIRKELVMFMERWEDHIEPVDPGTVNIEFVS